MAVSKSDAMMRDKREIKESASVYSEPSTSLGLAMRRS